VARIEIPNDVGTLRQADPARARDIQKRVSDAFLERFAEDLTVTGFERTDQTSAYLFSPWDS
jgi:hypothetical protein